MQIHLQTRGFGQQDDYLFIGRDPGERWWEAFSRYTNFEKPSLVVSSDGTTWRVAISGLPTSRRDVVNTPIRSMLLVHGDVTASDGDDVALVGQLVDAWLADQADGGGRVADRLDAAFPQEDIDSLLIHDDDAVWRRAGDRVRAVMEDLGKPADGPPTESMVADELPPSWIGRRANEPDRASLAGAVRRLVAGRQRGVACYLNLVRTGDYAITAVRSLTGSGADSVHLLTDLPAGELPVPKGEPRTSTRVSPWVLVGLTLVGLGVVVVLIWIANRIGQLPRPV